MPDQIRNERIKLQATWLNNTAVAAMSLGVLTPTLLWIFRSDDKAMQDGTVTGQGILICIGLAVFLHLLGWWYLRYLDNTP
jgi:hypothetical protein